MVIKKNVAKAEGIVRIIGGVILLFLGLSLAGFWGPLSIFIDVFLLVTAFVGY